MSHPYAIELKGICKSFGSVAANKNVELNVKPGEILALLGENGSGKTTLMNMLSGIYKPDSGQIFVDGQDVYKKNKNQLAIFRRRQVGMIYQFYNLRTKSFSFSVDVAKDSQMSLLDLTWVMCSSLTTHHFGNIF